MSAERALVRKELRAVAPLVAATAGILLLAGLSGIGPFESAGLIMYLAGSAAIGATLIGHELGQPLLGVLLVQPVARARLLRVKYLVGALALGAVGATALVSGVLDPSVLASNPAGFALLVMALALFVAPWLTMISGSALGGAVGTLVSPLVLTLLLEMMGFNPARRIVPAMVVLSGLAAVLGWRLFTHRLEDTGSRAEQIHFRLPWRRATGARRPAGRLGQLVAKEIRLQQLPIVLAGLYAAAGLLAWLTTDLVPTSVDPRQPHMAGLFGGMTALLIGALASAEERQMGTMPWQIILPAAAWRQFLVKTLAALALSAALTVGVPALLIATANASTPWSSWLAYSLAMLGLTLAGLYVSTLSPTSLRAFVVSPLVILAGVALAIPAVAIGLPAGLWLYDTAYPLFEGWVADMGRQSWRAVENRVGVPMLAVWSVGLVVMLWRFALANHSRAEHAARPVRRQAIAIGLYIVVATLSTYAVVGAMANGPTGRSAIAGVVLDEGGQPLSGVQVQALERRYLFGRHVLVQRGGWSNRTDERGRFTISGLSAGVYYPVAVTGAYVRWELGRRGGFAPTFYPDSTDAASARTVIVNGRDTVDGVTFTPRAARTSRLAGRVVDETGQPVAGAQVYFQPAWPGRDPVVYLLPQTVRSGSEGGFAFDHVPPGTYTVHVRGPGIPGEFGPGSIGTSRVTLAGEDVTNVEVQLGPGATLRGRLVFEGDAPRPLPNEFRVMTYPMDLVAGGSRSGDTDADWTFAVRGLAGRHVIRTNVWTSRRGAVWALLAVRWNGRDVTDTPLDFSDGRDLDGVEVVLTDRAGGITGTVNDPPARRAAVIVFPADPSGWTYPSRLLHQMSIDGFFRTPALLPGDYLLVAVRHAAGRDWQDPEVLNRLRALATPVTVEAGRWLDIALDPVRVN